MLLFALTFLRVSGLKYFEKRVTNERFPICFFLTETGHPLYKRQQKYTENRNDMEISKGLAQCLIHPRAIK